MKAAKEWQAAHCPHAGNRSGNKRGNQTVEFQLQVPLVDADSETLEESIERLRQIERSLGMAVRKVAADGHPPELRQLRRDHISAVKGTVEGGDSNDAIAAKARGIVPMRLS